MMESRGYANERARGIYYWLWKLSDTFYFYCHHNQFGEHRLFIDAQYPELARLLSTVEGVIPSDTGVTKNSKFVAFRAGKMNPHTGITEYEGWCFKFWDSESASNFLSICEEFDHVGLAGAIEKAQLFEKKAIRVTSKITTVATRVGQTDFRSKLLQYWKTCAVTGCNITQILKASHVKPWVKSDSVERLDIFNGLLLIPNLDSLFDSGLITFTDTGNVVLSTKLTTENSNALGISSSMRLRKVNTAHAHYLAYHREHVFKS